MNFQKLNLCYACMKTPQKVTIALLGIILVITLFVLVTWVPDISTPLIPTTILVPSSDKPIRYFGVVSRYTPREIFTGYQPIADYLTSTTPFRFEIKLSESYAGSVEQLAAGEVAVASLGSLVYVTSKKDKGLEVILKPLNTAGEAFFHIAFITKEDSPIHSLSDLEGQAVLFPSAESLTGRWMPSYIAEIAGITFEQLERYDFVSYHTTVAEKVMHGDFDAGVVKSVVAEQYVERGLRVFHLSPPIPSTPIVVSELTPQETREAITNALLQIDPGDLETRNMLLNWDEEFSYGFKLAEDDDYDVIRDLLKLVEVP